MWIFAITWSSPQGRGRAKASLTVRNGLLPGPGSRSASGGGWERWRELSAFWRSRTRCTNSTAPFSSFFLYSPNHHPEAAWKELALSIWHGLGEELPHWLRVHLAWSEKVLFVRLDHLGPVLPFPSLSPAKASGQRQRPPLHHLSHQSPPMTHWASGQLFIPLPASVSVQGAGTLGFSPHCSPSPNESTTKSFFFFYCLSIKFYLFIYIAIWISRNFLCHTISF